MNKKFIFSVMLAIFLILMANVTVSAQAFGNEAQRLIGTWSEISGRGATLVFNVNGSTTGWGWTQWGAIDNRLIMTDSGDRGNTYEFRFSQDGRTLFISRGTDGWMFRKN